jgi:hypothetical protein
LVRTPLVAILCVPMPRVFRLMKDVAGRPLCGSVAMALGVRPLQPGRAPDIPVDEFGNVQPGTGGMSVYASLRAMPARMVPKRLLPIVPSAAGSNNLRVWAMGVGRFTDGPIAPQLRFRVDPEDSMHGFIEPDDIMTVAEYEAALAATQSAWVVAEE